MVAGAVSPVSATGAIPAAAVAIAPAPTPDAVPADDATAAGMLMPSGSTSPTYEMPGDVDEDAPLQNSARPSDAAAD